MANKKEKTPPGFSFGTLPTDVFTIRQFMKELGWTETRLANKSGLSQPMINAFLNGKRKLSPEASDRVFDALREAFRADKEAAAARQSIDREFERVVIDKTFQAGAPDGLQTLNALAALGKLSGPPREPVAYRAWKAKQLELHAAADELRAERERNAKLESLLLEARETIADQKETISSLKGLKPVFDEMISIYKGQVEHLKKQLRDAGITPSDYFPPK